MKQFIGWMERGRLPDWLIRAGIRKLLRERLRWIGTDVERIADAKRHWVAELDRSPLAIETEAANRQHYEVPAQFFEKVLGKRLKYSSCLFTGGNDLDAAEETMLAFTCQRARIEDGMRILDLGCGWGSLTQWILERYPKCEVVALSNSNAQRDCIESRLAVEARGRIKVHTSNVADFAPEGVFDRIVSIEMFEHLRNYRELFSRLRRWLAPQGLAFAHVFCHRMGAYPFVDAGDDDWMARHFFSGGQMPSADLFHFFQDDLAIQHQWHVNGRHYEKTLLAWLTKLDADRAALLKILANAGPDDPTVQLQRWRVFLLACAELFGFNGGNEWHVAHYLWRRRDR